MIYAMSDPHGEYEKYIAMLKEIKFSDDDMLYVLGDVSDRGPDTAKIILHIMAHKNIVHIKGNHEDMACKHLPLLLKEFEKKPLDIFELYSRSLYSWFINGGNATVVSIFEHPAEVRTEILEHLNNLPYYCEIQVNNINYVLVHAGLGDNYNGEPLSSISNRDLTWSMPDYDGAYFDEKTKLVVGHTPTFMLAESEKASIYKGKGNVICLDCGAHFTELGGRLGCLCLDTGEEFYV